MELESCPPAGTTILPPPLEKGAAVHGPSEREAGGLSATLRRCMVVLLVTGAALTARLVLSPILHDDAAFLPFIFAVMLGSWYGGFRAGLLATLLSAAAAWLFLLTPFQTSPAQTTGYFVQLALFLGIGLLVSGINEAWHRARRRLIAHEEFLSTILESTPTGVLVLDAEGFVVFVNTAAAALFGLGSGLLVGRPYSEIGLVTRALPAGAPHLSLHDLLEAGESATPLRLVVEDAAAAPIEVEARVTRVRMASQQPGGLVLSLLPVQKAGGNHV